MLLRRGIITPTLPCVAAAARANGAVLDFEPERGASRSLSAPRSRAS